MQHALNLWRELLAVDYRCVNLANASRTTATLPTSQCTDHRTEMRRLVTGLQCLTRAQRIRSVLSAHRVTMD